MSNQLLQFTDPPDRSTKLLAALTTAARKQPDPVKRGKILGKIEEIKKRAQWNKFLGQ